MVQLSILKLILYEGKCPCVGQVVVVHDKQLLRLTGISQEIGLLNFSELPPLKSTIPIDFCPGENLTDNTVHEEERKFTLLSRVLEECPSVQVNIDIKDGSESLIDKVNEVVSKAKAEGDFMANIINKIKRNYSLERCV